MNRTEIVQCRLIKQHQYINPASTHCSVGLPVMGYGRCHNDNEELPTLSVSQNIIPYNTQGFPNKRVIVHHSDTIRISVSVNLNNGSNITPTIL